MPARVRIGAVNYLNTRPLVYNLERLAPKAQLSLDLPSRLADRLAEGALDVALIPVIEYFRGDGYTIVPNIAIATRGPALSVTLFSRVPWAQICRVALDEGSRTSAALTQILLRDRHGLTPQLQPLPTSATAEESDADAVLLIGDRAMKSCLPGYRFAYDLGQEWHDWTGLSFVYAFWAVRAGADLGGVEKALEESKRQGLAHVGEIAAAEAPKLGLDAGYCRRYLETVIRFNLGPREVDGLQRFYDLASELGLAPAGGELRFYGARRIGNVNDRSFETPQTPVVHAPGSPV